MILKSISDRIFCHRQTEVKVKPPFAEVLPDGTNITGHPTHFIDAWQYTDEFKSWVEDNLSYKGRRYVLSETGMKNLADLCFTIDSIGARIDKRSIIVDGETIYLKDYQFTKNICAVINASVVYTTESSRSREVNPYAKVVPTACNGYYVLKDGKDEEFEYTTKLLTPSQVLHVFNSIKRDTDLLGDIEQLVPGACTTFDFSVMCTENGEHLYEYVTGAKFTEQVVSILGVKGPFADEHDDTRDLICDKECLRWVFM